MQGIHWLIVGAGIGGLTLGAALRQKGHSFTVYEQQPSPTVIGAGIALAPNAMSALAKLGLAENMARRGCIITRSKLLADRGHSLLTDIDLSFAEKEYGTLPVAIHRNELLSELRDACGVENVQYGWRCASVDQSDSGVTIVFENGQRASGTALIGADGIHSVVSQAIAPRQPLNYRGFVAWRGICPRDAQLVPAALTTQIWGPGSVFGIAPVSDTSVYWYGTRLAEADFAQTATKDDALSYFANWASPVPEVVLGTDADAVLCHAIYDHDALPVWSKGRIAVLGDAAHAMPPNMGQGGAQAILDAVSLTESLTATSDLPAAWASFEKKRMKAANDMVQKSRRAAQMDHLQNPVLTFGRDMIIKLTPTVLFEQLLRPARDN